MKRILLIFILYFLPFQIYSQVNGNEWIDYTQSYYKFKIAKTGVYKLDYSALTAAGIDFTNITPDRFQVFGKQQQIPIYIVDGNDNSFDSGDYILFYAQKNDGWLDSLLYQNPLGIGNPGYSLYNDTINYYFSWNLNGGNLRYQWYDNQNFNAIPDETAYVLHSSILSLSSNYNDVKAADGYNSSSFYVDGEGWGENYFNGINGVTRTYNLSTPSPYTNANAPDVQFIGLSVSNSNAINTNSAGNGINHNCAWLIGSSQSQLFYNDFSGYKQIRAAFNFSPTLLTNGNTPVYYKVNASSDYATDYQSVSYISILYPKLTSLNNLNFDEFILKNSGTSAFNKLRLTQAPLSSNGLIFTLGNQPKVIPANNVGSNEYLFLIPNEIGGVEQKIVVSNSTSYIGVNKVVAVSTNAKFTYYSVDPNDDKVVLMIYNPKLKTSSNDYADYRRSPAGGGFTVVLANINELYDQYAAGIDRNVLAIRRFVQDIASSSNFIPQALYLIGKGVLEANNLGGNSSGSRKHPAYMAADLIPSFGYPSSDVCITAGLGSTIWEPLVPTGRIAANNDVELKLYLDKVKQHDEYQNPMMIPYNSENRDWQKQIIHFSGGASAADQNEFSYYLDGMKQTIQDTLYGAHVMTVKKTSSLPLDPVIVSEVTDRISKGASILNFFGHASADGFEINIDEPSNWHNTGKYPLVIGNACYSGDIFEVNPSVSERFVLTPQEGAIAFLSTVKTGFAFALNSFTSEFYRQLGYKNYNRPIGYLLKQTIKDVRNTYNQNIYYETTCSQMTLHGDPLLYINTHAKSELEIQSSSLFFEPNNFDLTVDSIKVNLILTNLGKSVTDTFAVDFDRKYPNNVDSVYHFLVPKINYKDTLSFKIPVGGAKAGGLNTFEVSVDLPSQIDEYENITNNQLKKTLFINSEGIQPVYPYNFAVVPYDTVTVKASTINPVAEWNNYRFELDTTDLFNSPEKRIALVSGYGGVKSVRYNQWLSSGGSSKPLICTDSTVYFWRVSIDSSVLSWSEFSFQYIPTKIGWGQAHFFQDKNNDFFGIDYLRNTRSLVFDTMQQTLGAKVINLPWSNEQFNANYPSLNGQAIEYGLCSTTPSFAVTVLDPLTFQPWGKYWNGQNPSHQFGNANNGSGCRNRMEYYFIFRQTSTSQLTNFENMLNSIPNGYYVIIQSQMVVDTSLWSSVTPTISQTFASIGTTQVQNSSGKSFVLVYRKGDPNFVREAVSSTSPGEVLIASFPIVSSKSIGVEESPFIGPSLRWETVYWKHHAQEAPSTDSCHLQIKYYNSDKSLAGTLNYLMTPLDSVLNINSIIDANQFPFLKLSATFTDTTKLTPAQLDRWHVLYQPVPEAAIDGSNLYTWTPNKDSLKQGESFNFAVDVKNISDYPMDSLLVHYWIEDINRSITPISYPRQDSLRVLQKLRDTLSISTGILSGDNVLWMEINPYINGKLDQLEQYHFNNLLRIPFSVKEDKINPILDVTFDGIHILNKDIVSGKCEIMMALKDENPYLIMDQLSDTSKFGIYIINPSGIQQRIPFMDAAGNTVMQVIPANGTNKRFKIIYHSDFKTDGVYTLLVQGADKSDNLSGKLQYRIQFEVVNESTITHIMNYPNPFSTSTRFVFTLTGNKVPDDMIIQIMTVTGKVVREIRQSELGPIRIGRNITEYAWDGRDDFGDQLANGVYLYRVLTRMDGETIKLRESGADKYFKKEFGKMYLLR